MTTYTPDPDRYQQIPLGGATGPYDCSAWSSAWIVDAHTKGGTKVTGRAIRLASDEPRPDPASPGLNLPQTDNAVYRLTSGKVNLDTRVQGQALTRGAAQSLIIDGRWAVVQVIRGILVDRTALSGFRGAHAITVHARPIDSAPVIGDPLDTHYVVTSWDAVWDAAEALVHSFAPGKVYAQFTRDLTPDYRAVIPAGPMYRYIVKDGRITGRVAYRIAGWNRTCTPPRYVPGKYARQLVMLTSGPHKGWYVNARYAHEVQP